VQITMTGFDSLPALTAEELGAIEAHTRATLADLLGNDSLSPATVRAYTSALRYWDAWHRAATGTPLPLLRQPRDCVDAATVCAFIAHHSPERGPDGLIRCAMPEPVRRRMREIGVIGRRQAQHRAAPVDAELPTLATIRQRIAALSACHRLARLTPPFADDPAVRQALRALANRASKSAPAMLRKPKAPVLRDVLEAMLRDCRTDGLRGLRDAALLHVAFHTGGRRRSELAAMRWRDLAPFTLPEPIEGVADGWLWTLSEMKGRRLDRAEGGIMQVPILGAAADALDRWRDVVLAAGKGSAADPVWWRLIPAREGEGWVLSTPMIATDVWRIVRERAGRVGLDPCQFGAHSLRSGAATTFLLEGGMLADASAMLGHAKLDTTREYYDRRGVPVAALARLVGRHKG
jgi:Site-specific recombinase XerD